MNFVVSFKGGKNITGDSEGFKGAFVGTDKLKEFFTAKGDVRRDSNALDVGVINQFVDFSSQLNHMSLRHMA